MFPKLRRPTFLLGARGFTLLRHTFLARQGGICKNRHPREAIWRSRQRIYIKINAVKILLYVIVAGLELNTSSSSVDLYARHRNEVARVCMLPDKLKTQSPKRAALLILPHTTQFVSIIGKDILNKTNTHTQLLHTFHFKKEAS